MKTKYTKYAALFAVTIGATLLTSCLEEGQTRTAGGTVTKKTVQVSTDIDGWTVEQKNIAERLRRDNQPGAIKHLYVISPYSGQVILYSTVKGKVTSSGKRLTPNTVTAQDGEMVSMSHQGMPVDIGGSSKATSEVLQDDGSYGSSCEYIYWFDSRDQYHSHFFTGGQIIHVSDQPMPVKNITINLEQQ
jgi:hypothetical protein